MKINKLRYLLFVSLSLCGLLYMVQGPEIEGFQGNHLSKVEQQATLRMEMRGIIAQNELDFVAVQDTLADYWAEAQPLHADLIWGVNYAPQTPEMNFQMWSQLQFDNQIACETWLQGLGNHANVQVDWQTNAQGIVQGFITARLPVSGAEGQFLELDRIPFEANFS